MDFTKSSLMKDAQRVLDNGRAKRLKLSAVFHVAGTDYQALKVESIDIERNYHKNFADVIILRVLIPMGTYAMRFYPKMSEIECTVTYLPAGPDGERAGYTEVPRVERFKAVMLNPSPRAVDLNKTRQISEQALNIQEMATADFQLINKAVDQMRGVMVSNVYRNCKASDVLEQMLTLHSKRVTNIEASLMPKGVEMVPATQVVEREHVNISPVLLKDLAKYLQKECNGIYAAGIGCYYQDDLWYVFPPFDLQRFNKAKRMLTVIVVPAGVLPAADRSYFKDGNHVIILATGGTTLSNESEQMINEGGSGLRFGNAELMMEGFVDTKDNVAIASRGKSVTEYSAIDRADGQHIAPLSNARITSNNLDEMSKLAARDGALFTATWEHAIHDILEPGMPTRIMYLDNGLARSMEGCLLKAHYFTYSTEGFVSNSYLCEAALSFFVQRKTAIHD